MQKIFNLFIIILISCNFLQGQCPDFDDCIIISPSEPYSNDCITLITDVTIRNLGYTANFELDESNKIININACYKLSPAAALMNIIDTLNLGVKEAGIYTVNYYKKDVRYGANCDTAKVYSTKQITFEVKPALASNPICQDLVVFAYPNPFKPHFFYDYVRIVSNKTVDLLELFDMSGKLLYQRKGTKRVKNDIYDLQTYPKGVYLVRITTMAGQKTLKIMIL